MINYRWLQPTDLEYPEPSVKTCGNYFLKNYLFLLILLTFFAFLLVFIKITLLL
jgi:hypothetical protein